METLDKKTMRELRQKHEDLLQRQNAYDLLDDEIIEKAENLLQELRVSGKIINDESSRTLLESFSKIWGLYIYENTGIYPKTSLQQYDNKILAKSDINVNNEDVDEKEKIVDNSYVTNGDSFYGRGKDLSLLKKYVFCDQYRLITILGIGGIGKTTLATKLKDSVQGEFQHVIWRSLSTAPYVDTLLKSIIYELEEKIPEEERINPSKDDLDIVSLASLFVSYIKKYRVLLFLDNLETILQFKKSHDQPDGSFSGAYQKNYEYYESLINKFTEDGHSSCLIITSRELPKNIFYLASNDIENIVETVYLRGLSNDDSVNILRSRGLEHAEPGKLKEIADLYEGNPLSLRLIATEIIEQFNGEASHFLKQENLITGSIYKLLSSQYYRLSRAEKAVMYWLAIEQDGITIEELKRDLFEQEYCECLPEIISSLEGRSLIIKSEDLLTLQSVIREYIIEKFIENTCQDILLEKLDLFNSHALLKAKAKNDNIREQQINLILNPLLQRLREELGNQNNIRERIEKNLSTLKSKSSQLKKNSGYAAGNILNLLCSLNRDLEGYDFSSLTVRQAYLQNANLHDFNCRDARFWDSIFTENFGNIESVRISPNYKILAASDTSNQIHLWHMPGGQKHCSCEAHTGFVSSIHFSPDSKLLASCGEDKLVKIWDVDTGQCLKIFEDHDDFVRSVRFSPNGKIIASGGDDETIRLWIWERENNPKHDQCWKKLQGHRSFVRSIRFSPDGKLLVSCSDDQTIKLWNIETGECFRTIEVDANVFSIDINPSGTTIASGGNQNTVALWDLKTGKCIGKLEGHTKDIFSVAFSPDGNTIASGSDDQKVILWDVENKKCLQTWDGGKSRIRSVVFSPDGDTLISGSNDQTIKLWDVATGKSFRKLQGYTNWIWSVAFSPDGNTLASASDDQTVRLWNIKNGDNIKTLKKHHRGVWTVAFSSDGEILASGSGDRTINIWGREDNEYVHEVTLAGHDSSIWSVAFSPDSRILASGSGDKTIRLWNTNTWQCINTLAGHTDFVRSVVFSPDGHLLASGHDKEIWMWDTQASRICMRFKGHTDFVRSVVFSPDGKTLASSGLDKFIRLWDIDTGSCYQEIPTEHTHWVWSVAFSPDGKRLVSSSIDKSIKIWDLDTGHCIQHLHGHDKGIWTVNFSPNGQYLASGGQDEKIKIWKIDSEDYTDLIHRKPYSQTNITGVSGLNDAEKETLLALGAYEE